MAPLKKQCERARMGNDMIDPLWEQGSLIYYPEFVKLKSEVDKLRTELSMLVLERDELLLVECRNIEMAYMLGIGCLEYKAFEIECAIARLKRKAALIQAKKNRQEKVVLSKIEETLDDELAEYQLQLSERLDKMNSAIERSRSSVLTQEEMRELKSLYRTVVKALHPDLNPSLSDAKIRLFYNAVKAYESGDLSELKVISAMIGEAVLPDHKSEGLALLVKEKERLIVLLENVHSSIAKIKSEYPYTMKSLLQSAERTEERKKELRAGILELSGMLAICSAKIDDMLR